MVTHRDHNAQRLDRPYLRTALAGLLFLLLGTARADERAEHQELQANFLIVGGDESGCAAAMQAARLGVHDIVLVNDIDWLGGQFCTQGIGPIDEWTIVDGKRTEFPVSGAFQEILERIHAHNRQAYGHARPGNGWCGSNTIEPRAAAAIFEQWLQPYASQIRILKGWEPERVLREGPRVQGVVFRRVNGEPGSLTVRASLTADSTDWGDVIRLSGAAYMAGPDLKSRFGEPSAPEILEDGGHQEMNPITWCALLREASGDSVIRRPARYDERSFAAWKKVPPWVDWDGSGGIYNFAGWSIYTHRRLVDRYHFTLAPGTEALILNWPGQDYPLSTLPQHVVAALEEDEQGASRKNIVDLTPAQRRLVFEDAKQRTLEFVYWLQTAVHDRVGDFPQSFRYMRLADDYGTPDQLPFKPYIREGLRLEAMYVLREQDVRTESSNPRWAQAMVPDGVFGYQFNLDFHPTRRQFVDDDRTQPWHGRHVGTRNWSAHTDRAMFPLRGLIPVEINGLLGCSKNIGVTSMVQSSLRLHGQMMHVGTAVGTLAAHSLRAGVLPRHIALSYPRVYAIQQTLVRGTEGPGTLIWPWHDVRPDERHFEAANMLPLLGIWSPDADSLFFQADRVITRGELAGTLARLCRAIPGAKDWPELPETPRYTDVPADDQNRPYIEAMIAWGKFGPQQPTFQPRDAVTWSTLNRWLVALDLPSFPSLTHPRHKDDPLTRAECVDYLYRVFEQRNAEQPWGKAWFLLDGDLDRDGRVDRDDPLPWDHNNDSVSDRLQPPEIYLRPGKKSGQE